MSTLGHSPSRQGGILGEGNRCLRKKPLGQQQYNQARRKEKFSNLVISQGNKDKAKSDDKGNGGTPNRRKNNRSGGHGGGHNIGRRKTRGNTPQSTK
jgi:hypothetical protein